MHSSTMGGAAYYSMYMTEKETAQPDTEVVHYDGNIDFLALGLSLIFVIFFIKIFLWLKGD